MSSYNPPIPPRPPSVGNPQMLSSVPPPPPLPPHPPSFRQNGQSMDYSSPPHFEQPMAAPKPHRLDPSIPANMARTLEASTYPQQPDYRRLTPVPPPPPAGVNVTPGFMMPSAYPAPGRASPNPQAGGWSPWLSQGQPSMSSSPPRQFTPLPTPYPSSTPGINQLNQSMGGLAFSSQPPQHPPRQPSYSTPAPARQTPSPPRDDGLTKAIPTVEMLSAALPSVQNQSGPLKLNWCRDVMLLADRAQQNAAMTTATEQPVGPLHIADAQLSRLANIAVPMVLQLASPNPPINPLPVWVAEAVYLRATFASSGSFPEHVPRNPRTAFRDFEASARAGYHPAWFRLGRDYENFNDFTHARDCFERGSKNGVESCVYRLAMCNLMGQLGLPVNVQSGIALLQRAASLASLEVPQPAYVYALLLLNEFTHVTVPTATLIPYIPNGSSVEAEAKKYLEKAAYLHFPAAQYKLGHAFEFSQPPFPFDPLMSVQYYSLASQHGEAEADMALSKWFLCGAEGAFEKDEALAVTFAEKAAKKGLPNAEFAMGYYAEVGVGGPRDLNTAIKWYTKATEHDNVDAKERLQALQQSSNAALSRQEHDHITEAKLVRKRTDAKARSDERRQDVPPPMPTMDTQKNNRRVIEHVRKNSVARDSRYGPGPSAMPTMSPMFEHPGTPSSGSPAMPQARPRPQKQGQQAPPQSNRFTLTDPGAGSASSPRPASEAPSTFRPPGQRPGGGGGTPNPMSPPPSTPPAMSQAGSKRPGPATFQEMGIQSTVVQDKDCVIM